MVGLRRFDEGSIDSSACSLIVIVVLFASSLSFVVVV